MGRPAPTQTTLEISEEDWQRAQQQREALQARVNGLQAFRDVARALSLELNLRPLLYMIMDSAAELLGATASTLLLHDKERHELVFNVVSGGGGMTLEERRMPDDSGVPGWVIANQLPLIVNDARNDPRVRHDIADSVDYAVSAILAVPLSARGNLVGVLEVLNKRSGGDFTGEDLEVLSAFASQAAVAIENARLYAELREERDRLVEAEETIRRKLQEELHDGLAQDLSSMAMKANAVSRGLARDPERASVELAVIEDDLRAAVSKVRSLLFDLRPLVLETQGLEVALDTYVRRVAQASEASIHLSLEGFAGRLERVAEVTVFSIVQEALVNIVKHAAARNIWITLAGTPAAYVVTVRDDGRGFSTGSIAEQYGRGGSYGLLNMQERAAHIGGQLSVSSEPGSGTTVTLEVGDAKGGSREPVR